jgi:hypothetical protein
MRAFTLVRKRLHQRQVGGEHAALGIQLFEVGGVAGALKPS